MNLALELGMRMIRFAPSFLIVSVLITSMPIFARASSGPKSFAVFQASLNDQNQAVGGVAGTAFFISPTEAVTAYHVLQERSFVIPSGFRSRQVWLVHESLGAIEVSPSDVVFESASDLTRIHFKDPVAATFVYERGEPERGTTLSTDGFRVNSTGPVLEKTRAGLRILRVPRLERVHLEGQLIRQTRVSLESNDVRLENQFCIQADFEPIRGISGGPLLADGRVIAVNSFGIEGRTWGVQLAPR